MTVYLNGKSGDAVKAFQLFNDTFPRSTYRFRAKYWLARSYQKEKNTEQAKKLLSEIYRDSPLTYYGLLSSLELGTPIAKRFSAEVPEVAEIDPYVTPVEAIRLRRAQKLIAADLGEFATLDLKELKARDSATNEYLLYLAALNSEAGNHVGAFGLLSELIARGYEGIYSSFGLKLVFPVVQQELIKKNSAAIDLDPILALSLMKQESAFDAIVHSSSGASGLMQLMPTTAVDTEPTVKRSLLLDPDTNIRVGTKYLKKMLNRYDGNVAMALAAYNAGPGAVDRWIREGKAKLGLLEFIEAIPFKETREYVGSILRNYYWYTQKIKGETIPDLSRFWVNPKNMSVPSAPAPGPSAEPATPGVPAPVAPDTAPEIQGPRPRANPSDSPTTQSTVPSAGQE
ncbi:MAG: transglycosylase SLT domain-containing protein [Methylotenera sp.]|nr:transglycosylase SLT domain-containing protein [Oligoflexia bacterium]